MSDLIRVGDKLYDPTTGSRVTFIELRPDGFLIEQTVEPHKTQSILDHYHKTWTERFEIISGVGRYMVAGQEHDAGPGHVFVVNPGQAHIHPWNTGSEELRFRQLDTFVPADANAAVDTFLGFSTMFGLALEGKARPDGTPKNALQLMVVLEFFRRHGSYLSGIPGPVQDILMGAGAALGRALGYRAWYEQYLPARNTDKR